MFLLCLITTPPVTVVFSGAPLISMTVILPPVSVGQITLGQQDVVLPPRLMLRDTMMDSAGITNMPKQLHPHSHMPSQACANYAMGPSQVSFSFER